MKRILLFALLFVSSFAMRAQGNFIVTNFDSKTNIVLASWITGVWTNTATDPINSSNKVGYFNGDNATNYLSTKGTFATAIQPTFANALIVQGAVLKCRLYVKSGTFATSEQVKIIFAQNALANAGSYYDPNQIQFLITPTVKDSWIDISLPITGVNNKLYDFVQIGTTSSTTTNAEFYIDDIEIATAAPTFSFERAYCSTDGKQIMIKCNHSIVPTTDFTGLSLLADGNALPIKSVSVDNTDKNLLAISLVDSVLATNSITASYSAGAIQDSLGFSLNTFSDTVVANLVGISIIKKWRDDFNNVTDDITNTIGATNPPFTSLTEDATGEGVYSVTMNGSVGWQSLTVLTFGTGLTDPKQVIDLTGHENIKFRYRILGNSNPTCSLRVDVKDKTTGCSSDQMAFIPLTISNYWKEVTVNLSKILKNVYGPITGNVDKGTIYQTSLYFIEKEGNSSSNYNPTNFKGTIEFDYIEIGADNAPLVDTTKTVNCTAGSLSNILTQEEKNAILNLTLTGTIDARDFKTMRDSMPGISKVDISKATIVAYQGDFGTYHDYPNIYYPANTIPNQAFYNEITYIGKASLKTIVLPETAITIDRDAFARSGITSVFIPSNITTIAHTAFNDNAGPFSVDANNPNYSSIDGVLFNKTQDSLIVCPTSKQGSYSIPSTVKTIAWGAFLNCAGLHSLTIPTSVTNIDEMAFAYCSGLLYLFTKNPVPVNLMNSTSAFIGVDTNICVLNVPSAATNSYIASPVWKSFKQIFESTPYFTTGNVLTDFDAKTNIIFASWITGAWTNTGLDPVNAINKVGHFKGDGITSYLSTKATCSASKVVSFNTALSTPATVLKCRVYLKSGTLVAGEKLYLIFAHDKLANAGSYYDPNQIKLDITPSQTNTWVDFTVPITGVSDELYDFVQIGTSSTTTTKAEFYIDDIELGTIPKFTLDRGFSSKDGKSISLYFNNEIDKTSDFSGLTLSVDGVTIPTNSFAVDKNILTITVVDTIKAGQTINVSFPSGNVKDIKGLLLEPITDYTVINYYGITRLFGWYDDFNSANDAKLNDLTLGTSFTSSENITGTGTYQITGKAASVKWDPIILNIDKQNGKQVLDLTGHETVTIRYKVPSAVSTKLYLRIDCKDYVNGQESDGMAFIPLSFVAGSTSWTTKTIDLRNTFVRKYDVAGTLNSPPLIVDRSNIQQLSFYFIQSEGTPISNYIPTIFNGVIDLDYIYVGIDSTIVKKTDTLKITSCGKYTLNDSVYTSSGIYTQTLKNVSGGDSVITLNLTINPLPSVTLSTINSNICANKDFKIQATCTSAGNVSYKWNNGEISNTCSVVGTNPNASTTSIYVVTATDANGCANTASTSITVFPIPTILVSASKNIISIGDSSVITATGGNTYLWSNGVNLNSIKVGPKIATTYMVTGTNQFGCRNFANSSIVVLKPQIALNVVCLAGKLSDLITKNKKDSVTNLTITGAIDARDFKTMRDSMPNLEYITLSGASIVAYTGLNGTQNSITNYPANAIPINAFSDQSNMTGKSSLKSILFPTSLNAIGAGAFMFCSNLQSVSISATVTSIGTVPFGGCSASIDVNSLNPNYSSIDGILYNKAKDTLINCPITKTGSYIVPTTVKVLARSSFLNCKNLTSIDMPSVTDVESWAFAYDSSLTTVNFSSSLTKLFAYSFESCTGLKTITVMRTVPVDLSNQTPVFGNVNTSACQLNVPVGSVNAYKAADQWKDFINCNEYTSTIKTAFIINDFDANTNISLSSWISGAWTSIGIDPVNSTNKVGYFKSDNATSYLWTKGSFNKSIQPTFINALSLPNATFKCKLFLKAGTLAAGEKVKVVFAQSALADAGSYYDPNQIELDLTPTATNSWVDISIPISGVNNKLYDYMIIGTTSSIASKAEFYIDDLRIENENFVQAPLIISNIVNNSVICTVTDSINGGLITWYSDSLLTQMLAIGNTYSDVLTKKSDQFCYATRTISSFTSTTTRVFAGVGCNKIAVIIPPIEKKVPFYKGFITLKNNMQNSYWRKGNDFQPKSYSSVYTYKIDKVDTSYTIFSGSDNDPICADDIEYHVTITNDLPFLNTTDTTISMNVGDSMDVIIFKSSIDNIISLAGESINSKTDISIMSPKLGNYDVYTIKTLKSGVDTIIWDNIGIVGVPMQLKRIIIYVSDTTCRKFIPEPPRVVVVPSSQDSVLLFGQAEFDWYQSSDFASAKTFIKTGTDCTYKLPQSNTSFYIWADPKTSKTCSYPYIPFEIRVMKDIVSNDIYMNVGDSIITSNQTYNDAGPNRIFQFERETFQGAIDTLKQWSYSACFNVANPLNMNDDSIRTAIDIVGCNANGIYSLKAMKVGIDTLVYKNSIQTKTIIIHITDTISVPAPQITPNSFDSPFFVSDETANIPVTLLVKDSLNAGLITWYSDSLMTKVVGSGNKYTVVPPFKYSNTMYYVTRTVGTKVSEKIKVGISVGCNKMAVETIIEVSIPLYKENIVLKTTLPDAIWSLGSNIQKGSIFSYKIDKADTSYSINLDQQDRVLCGYISTSYHVTITNDLPFVNTTDTTITMNVGDSIDVAFLAGNILGSWQPIVQYPHTYLIDTVSAIHFVKSIDNEYDIYTFKAFQAGVDTLLWAFGYLDNVIKLKKIVFHVGQLPNDSCPKIVLNPEIRCSSNNQLVGNPYSFSYSYKPLNVFPIDTMIEKSLPLRLTVTYNNGCKVLASNSIISDTIVESPATPITDTIVRCDEGSVPDLSALTNKSSAIFWQDVLINNTTPVDSGSIFKTGKNAAGIYYYQVYAQSYITGCQSEPVTIKLQIFSATMPSISGTVLAASAPFSNGIVQLFKQNGTSYTAISTQNINTDGTFNFKWLDQSDYLIRALPNDLQSVYLPSYYVNSSDWQTANVISLKGKIIGLHLNLVESQVLSTGTGSISGSVDVADTNFASSLKTFVPIKMSVLVMQNGKIVAYALTDANGNYTVDNLPDGTYDIYIEVPGYAKFAKSVTISGGTQASVDFTLKNGVVETSSSIEINNEVQLYPNPANENVSIQTDKELLAVEVINIEGISILKLGNQKIFSVSQIPAGVYTVKIISESEIITKRLIKQ